MKQRNRHESVNSSNAPAHERLPVLLNWQANNTFGWGILGLNIFFHWANDPDVQPLMGAKIIDSDVQMVDSLRLLRIANARSLSNQFVDTYLKQYSRFGFPVIESLGNGLSPKSAAKGTLTIGRCIFEDTRLEGLDDKLAKYDCLLCASRWNLDLLRANTKKPVAMIHEGIDQSLFCPGPKSGILDQRRFYVFSGGKVEFRKAQDLVLRAFQIFSSRHEDAVLVTSWHSPWPAISAGFKGTAQAELKLASDGRIDVLRWATENGIRPDQVIDVGPIPNPLMPTVLREMDCSLQVSRAEAFTNLPAKEAMACGIPVILSRNTGVLDLISGENCLALTDQQPVPTPPSNTGTEGWGESNVDEIVAALEKLYEDSEFRERVGRNGARWIVDNGRTWQQHSERLKGLVTGTLPPFTTMQTTPLS